MFIATERLTRNTRVASRTAMVPTRTGIEVPRTESTTSAMIKLGTAIRVSTMRDSAISIQCRVVAAANPNEMPMTKDSKVISKARVTLVRPPKSRRERMSRPRLSRPSQDCAFGAAQTSPTNSAWPYGAIHGAKAIAAMLIAMMARPTTPLTLRR
jgi:hypothetical protein